MKKVAIVTWVRGCNYGTMLQAFSLCDTVRKMGCDVELLNDSYLFKELTEEPVHMEKKESAPPSDNIKNNKARFYFRKAMKAAYVLSSPTRYREYRNSRTFELSSSNKLRAFLAFKRDYLPITDALYKDDLPHVGSQYDIYICGSDQIWTIRTDRATDYYYLGFTEDSKKRIAYAPCIGDYRIPEDALEFVKRKLDRFDGLSMRDAQGAELISRVAGKEVSVVVDPVLLKTKDDWIRDFSLKKTNEQYLLCYMLGVHDWYTDYVMRISKALNLKIKWIPVNPEQAEYLNGHTEPCGPKEFLERFYNATYILTDSFHGTLFSLIFEKQVTVLKRYDDGEDSQNNRIYAVFSDFQIEKKMFGANEVQEYSDNPIDYRLTAAIIASKREEAKRYLSEKINNTVN